MFNARRALILAGLIFAIWETVDVFWISVPAAAAVFAALFLGSTIWFSRRDSIRAAIALTLLFAFEAAVAPTLNALAVTKVTDFTLALTGIALGIAVIVTRRRTRPSRAMVA
jgi:FtsH-binding integral membrane protein